MKIQQTLRSELLAGTSRGDFLRKRDAYINQALIELNSRGMSMVRIDDEPVTIGPLGNVYGRITIIWEADTDDPIFQKWLNSSKNNTATEQETTSSGGCYIASCVYGSYDCPQVWVLRRYRDNKLASTWYGRAFIHIYYVISPTLVQWFGHTDWFRHIWKQRLDKFIAKLKTSGVMDTPYEDRNW